MRPSAPPQNQTSNFPVREVHDGSSRGSDSLEDGTKQVLKASNLCIIIVCIPHHHHHHHHHHYSCCRHHVHYCVLWHCLNWQFPHEQHFKLNSFLSIMFGRYTVTVHVGVAQCNAQWLYWCSCQLTKIGCKLSKLSCKRRIILMKNFPTKMRKVNYGLVL